MKKQVNQIELDYSLKQIVKSSLFIFLGVTLSKIITYVYRVIIARYFGPEIYGLFSLATIIFFWFIAFSSLGLLDGILRFVSFYRGKGEINKIRYTLRFSLIILFFSSILAGVILYFLSGFISINIFHNSNLIIFLKIFSFLIPFYMISYALLTTMQAFERIKMHTFLVDFLQNFIKLSSLIFLIFIGINTNSVIFSYYLGIFGIFILSFFYCRYKIPEIFPKDKLNKKTKRKIRSDLLSYSWPLIFLGIISSIMSNIDSFTIGYFKNAVMVGIYNAAVPIAELIAFFPGLFMRLFSPLVNREFSSKNLGIVGELSKQVVKWVLIVNLPFFLLMILFPGAFINILFGAEYMAAENSLRFLAIGFFFYSLSTIFYSLISMVGKSKVILTNIVIASILNLVLNIFLVPRYGITGAAFATMISQIFLSLAFLLQVKYYTSIIPLKKEMLKIFFVAIPPTLLLIYIKQFIPINFLNLILQGFLFILFYLLLIFITKSLDKNDIMILKAFKKKII